MTPVAPGSLCGVHRDQPATDVCPRCGLFICAQCVTVDRLCPACVQRELGEPQAAMPSGHDMLGYALIAVPVVGGAAIMFLPKLGTFLSLAIVGGTTVLIALDAKARQQAATSYVVGAVLLWLAAYPAYLHQRAKWGAAKLLPWGLGAMAVYFAGIFVHPFAPQERATVVCKVSGKTLGEGYDCLAKRTEGQQSVRFCWSLVADCGTVTGQASNCVTLPAGATQNVHVPFSALAGLDDRCTSLKQSRVTDLTVTILP
jgi:hypothetical protein